MPTEPKINPEFIKAGSPRHKELLELQKRKETYQAQQDYFNSLGLNLKATPFSKLDPAKFSPEIVEKYKDGQLYSLPHGNEGLLEAQNEKLGVNIFSDPSTGTEYLTGMTDPGDVPDYEIEETATFELDPAHAEKTYFPVKGMYTRSGNTYEGTIGTGYGYGQDDPNLQFSPTNEYEYYNTPGMTRDSFTTKVLTQPGDIFSKDSKALFTKAGININRINEYLPGSFEGVKQGILPPSEWAAGGPIKQQFPNGGFVSKIGDTAKLIGDSTLSTIGLTDVISDKAYKNQGFADASRVGEKIGLIAGNVIGNAIAPGVGGQIVSMSQKMLGNIDGEDEERARIERMRANPEAYGKHAGTIGQMSGAIKPLELGVSYAGSLAPLLGGDFKSMSEAGNILQTAGQMKAYGGKIDMKPDGGKFIEYQGPTHEGGGINVDQNGMPVANSNIEVEGHETLHDNGIEDYVFSNRIIADPDKKKTYADISKDINNKYKRTANDKISEDSRLRELEALKYDQESFKGSMSTPTDNFCMGGKMNKYPDGGTLPPYMYSKPLNKIDDTIDFAYNLQNTLSQPPESIFGTPVDTTGQNAYLFGQDYNAGSYPIRISSEDEKMLSQPQHLELDPRFAEVEAAKPRTISGELPQDKINPLGFAASNIGNVYDLFQAGQATKPNEFGRADFQEINLDAQRKELEKQAGVAREVARQNARQSGTAGTAHTNRVIANALISSGLSSGLSESYLTEATQNTMIKNQEKQINLQTQIQESLADQQDLAMRKSTISQAMHNIGMNTQGYVKDLKSANVGNVNNKMWFDAIKSGKYLNLEFDSETNTTILTTKDGRVWGKSPDGSIVEVKKDSK